MAEPTFYIDLFTPETWKEAAARDYSVTGFSERRRAYARRIGEDDIFLCYLTGKSRFIGALRATSTVFNDTEPIWKSQVFPTRFHCELIVKVPEDHGIHLREVQGQSAKPDTYNWIFRASPHEMPTDDAQWILRRLQEIATNAGPKPEVEIQVGGDEPASEVGASADAAVADDATVEVAEPTTVRAHVRIQWKLAKLGYDMGLKVWIARNDKNATYDGQRLGDLSVEDLPVRFDDTTQGTIERIDVLWLKRNRIEAAFEIEHSTAIYSGLLRMSDLLAMQPNIDIPLFIVAPEERRDQVHREIRRPTFTRLETPLHQVCRYVSFSKLEEALDRLGDTVKYMRPDFMDSVAESVA